MKKILLSVTLLLIIINISCSDREKKLEESKKWHEQAWDLVEKKKYEEAIPCFDKALALDEKNVNLWFNKGNALMCQGKYKESLECYDKALEIEPENGYVKYNRETVVILLKKEEEKNKSSEKERK